MKTKKVMAPAAPPLSPREQHRLNMASQVTPRQIVELWNRLDAQDRLDAYDEEGRVNHASSKASSSNPMPGNRLSTKFIGTTPDALSRIRQSTPWRHSRDSNNGRSPSACGIRRTFPSERRELPLDRASRITRHPYK